MSAFEKYHPFVLMLYFIFVLLISMFVWNPVIIIIAFVGALLFYSMLSSGRELLSSLGFYIPLLLLIAITNPLFSHNGITPLFFMNGNPITLEAIVYGIAIAVMIIGVMIWFKCYSRVMTTDKFVYLFGRIWPKLSLTISMALRFIPQFKKQMYKVTRTQKAMGLYSQKSYLDRIKGRMRVISVMIGYSLENSIEKSNSMKARGYGLRGRTNYSIFKKTRKDIMLLVITIILVLTTLLGVSLGKTYFQYYPSIGKIGTDEIAMITYSAYVLLALLPFIIEVEENIKWKYYRSKI